MKRAGVGDDIRRIPILNDDLTYDELILMMQRVFKGVLKTDEDLVLKYKDEDGDLVSLVDTNDLTYAIQYSRVLRLTIISHQTGDKSVDCGNVFDKEVVKELRIIRDRVNHLLDMVVSDNKVHLIGISFVLKICLNLFRMIKTVVLEKALRRLLKKP